MKEFKVHLIADFADGCSSDEYLPLSVASEKFLQTVLLEFRVGFSGLQRLRIVIGSHLMYEFVRNRNGKHVKYY